MDNHMIEIRIPKGVLYLTNTELTSLLARDKELWKRAIHRGKMEKRANRAERTRTKIKDSTELEYYRMFQKG